MCRKREPVCQVCSADLVALKIKAYCIKKRACPEHMAAEAVTIPGRQGMYRFCHQCGRFEPLACFDGMRRSCRTRLVTRRLRLSRGGTGGVSPGTSTSDAFAAAAAGDAAAAADTASAPGSSPAMGLNAAGSPAPGAHSSSVLSVDAAPMQLRDHQGRPHSAAAGVAFRSALQPQQQPQQHGGVADADFEEFLHGVMEEELQQIMQQDAAPLGTMSAPVPLPSALQTAVMLGSNAAGLPRTASTSLAMFNAAALAPGLQAGCEDVLSVGAGAAVPTLENTALRRQQLLLQAKQLLEEERQLRELAITGSDDATTCLTDALCARDAAATVGAAGRTAGRLAAMQAGSIADSLARVLLAPPGFPPAAAGHLLLPGSLQVQQQPQLQLLLPQVAAAAPLPQDSQVPGDIVELRRQLQQATAQLQELKTVVSSTVSMMSGGAPYFGPAMH